MYATSAQVRSAVAKALLLAAEIGTEELPIEIADIIFHTDQAVLNAAVKALSEGGDTFAMEVSDIHSQYDGDALAFRLAMALHRSGN